MAKLIEITEKYREEDAAAAEAFINEQRLSGSSKGYTVSKAGYVHKDKKSKGEIIDSCEIVTVVKVYNTIWEEE